MARENLGKKQQARPSDRPDFLIVHQELKEQVRHILSKLGPTRQRIVRYRLGIDQGRALSWRQIAEKEGWPRSRAQDTFRAAIREIHFDPLLKKQLELFL